MSTLHEYPVRIPQELHEATGESYFRKQTNDWQDVDHAFKQISEQARIFSETDPRFQFKTRTMAHDRMSIIELTLELPEGQDVSFAMFYQQESDEAFCHVDIFDETIRLKTAWLPSGLMVAVPLYYERVLEFEPCLVGDDFIERIVAYMTRQKEAMEIRAQLYGEPTYPLDFNPFFAE